MSKALVYAGAGPGGPGAQPADPQKFGPSIFSDEKPKTFQGPKIGTAPQPIWAYFVHMAALDFVGKNGRK